MNSPTLGLRSLSGNILTTLGRQVLAGGIGLLGTILIARVFGPEGNGTLAVAMLLPTMLATFLNLGVGPANVYFLGSSSVGVRPLLAANTVVAVLLSGIGLTAGAIVIYQHAEGVFPGIDANLLWFALSVFPMALLSGFLKSVFQGLQRFRLFNSVAIAQPLIYLGLVGAITISGLREISLLIGAQILSHLLVLVILIVLAASLFGMPHRTDLGEGVIRKILGYGWKAHLSNILAFVNYKADIFIANLFLGPPAVGIYVIAVALAEKLWLVSQAVSTVLLPRLSQLSSDEDKRRQLTPFVSRWLLVLTASQAVVLAMVSPALVSLLFGMEFLGALQPLWILLPGIVLASASRVLANDLASRGRPELNMYTSIVVVIVNIAANLVLIPRFGLRGAALATTVAYAVNLVFRLIMYRHITSTPASHCLFPRRSDLGIILAETRR